MNPLDRLRYHVTGAIERGEGVAIVEKRAPETSRTILTPSEPWPFLQAKPQSAKEKARAERERIKNLPVAPF